MSDEQDNLKPSNPPEPSQSSPEPEKPEEPEEPVFPQNTYQTEAANEDVPDAEE